MGKMRATVFHGVNDIRVEEVERPRAGVGEAVIRVTLTTICGTPASASIRAKCRFLMKLSRRGSAITASSLPCAPAVRNGCGD